MRKAIDLQMEFRKKDISTIDDMNMRGIPGIELLKSIANVKNARPIAFVKK